MTTQLLCIGGGLIGLGLGHRAMALEPSPQEISTKEDTGLNPATVAAVGWAPPTMGESISQKSPNASLASQNLCLPAASDATFCTATPAKMPLAIGFSPVGSPSETLALDPEVVAPTLDLDPAIIEDSPVLQRWLDHIPDIADEIRNQPSFRPRLRVGYVQFPSTGQISGFAAAVEDVFVVPGTGLTASADYSRSWNGQRESYGGEARYYLLPLGGYVNVAPTVGYRSLSTPTYQTDGLEVGLRLMLVPSRGGGGDLALSQQWVAPGSESEVGITSLAIGYAVTRQLRLGTEFQVQNSRFGQDSMLGISLELLL